MIRIMLIYIECKAGSLNRDATADANANADATADANANTNANADATSDATKDDKSHERITSIDHLALLVILGISN